MELSDLQTVSGEWLRGAGAESDVVLSSRIRLARNLAGFAFATRASEESKADILARVKAAVEGLRLTGKRFFVDVSAAPALDARFLVERHLISRELVLGKGPRGGLHLIGAACERDERRRRSLCNDRRPWKSIAIGAPALSPRPRLRAYTHLRATCPGRGRITM